MAATMAATMASAMDTSKAALHVNTTKNLKLALKKRNPPVEGDGEMSSQRRLSLLTAASALANLAPCNDGPDVARKAPRIESETAEGGQDEDLTQSQRKRFPEVLMDVLSYEPAKDMISWLPDGKAFMVTKPFDLSAEILPKFFKQAQFESFVRKLNRWGFRRVVRGKNQGAFYHEHFVRGKPELSQRMKNQRSVALKGGSKTAKKNRERRATASKQLVAAFAADAAQALSLRPPIVDTSTTPNPMDFVDALKSAEKARFAAMLKSHVMKIRMASMAGANATKLPADDGGISRFSLNSAMNLNLTREMVKNRTTFPHRSLSSIPTPSSRCSASSSRPSAAPTFTVRNNSQVQAAFLRHQNLLTKTQESRAMLQRAGLMAKPETTRR